MRPEERSPGEWPNHTVDFERLTLPIDRACLQKSHGSLRRTIVDAADGDRSTTDLVQPLLDGPNRYRGFHPALRAYPGYSRVVSVARVRLDGEAARLRGDMVVSWMKVGLGLIFLTG